MGVHHLFHMEAWMGAWTCRDLPTCLPRALGKAYAPIKSHKNSICYPDSQKAGDTLQHGKGCRFQGVQDRRMRVDPCMC